MIFTMPYKPNLRQPYPNELYHFGILGQKWGVRRFQNPDGTLTAEGKKRYTYDVDGSIKKFNRRYYDEKGGYSKAGNRKVGDGIYKEIRNENKINGRIEGAEARRKRRDRRIYGKLEYAEEENRKSEFWNAAKKDGWKYGGRNYAYSDNHMTISKPVIGKDGVTTKCKVRYEPNSKKDVVPDMKKINSTFHKIKENIDDIRSSSMDYIVKNQKRNNNKYFKGLKPLGDNSIPLKDRLKKFDINISPNGDDIIEINAKDAVSREGMKYQVLYSLSKNKPIRFTYETPGG